MADPERIWLEPPPGAPDTGRLWCKDDVWSGDPAYAQDGPPTEYVRGDLHEARVAELEAALRPFAKLKPSDLFDDAENEPYVITLSNRIRDVHFRRSDIIRARRALGDGHG